MVKTACGPKGSYQSNRIYDVSAELYRELAKDGAAVLVTPAQARETATPPAHETRGAPEAGSADGTDEEWPLQKGPEEYLDRYPDGPKADLARRILGRDTEG
jgi:hypothetical protein